MTNLISDRFIKILFFCLLISTILLVSTILLFYSFTNYDDHRIMQYRLKLKSAPLYDNYDYSDDFAAKLQSQKYILLWTSPNTEPFALIDFEQDGFVERKCYYSNCYVTTDQAYFDDITKFDVILFNGPEFVFMPLNKWPQVRKSYQKYVFVSTQSSHFYPMCSNKFDGYFNWTWTYRLDSDVNLGYILVKDVNNNVIGPRKVMHWMKLEDMEPISKDMKEKLKSKHKAAVWFVNICNDRSGRKVFADKLKAELSKYNQTLDIYGKCGNFSCGSNKKYECDILVNKTYYFCLAFENSFSEDYVTDKLLRALQEDVVPIVFGSANYTRFMPDGIYLNAREMGVQKLAAKINELINDPDQYADYFKWKNHYKYQSSNEEPENNDYCNFCALLNNQEKMRQTTIIHNLRTWWDNPDYCKKTWFRR